MKEIYLTKNINGSFTPAMDSDKEITDQLKQGQTYRFKVSKMRNYKFLQKFFVLCKIVYDNQSAYNNFDHFRHDLTMESGFYEEVPNKFTGEVRMVAKSISFASMNEFDFNQFFQSFIDTVCRIYDYDEEIFREEIEEQTKKIV